MASSVRTARRGILLLLLAVSLWCLLPGGAWAGTVAIVRGKDPDKMVAEAIEMLGGMKQFVKDGQKVVIKPNLVHQPALPGREQRVGDGKVRPGFTTDVRIVKALARQMLAAAKCKVTVAHYVGTFMAWTQLSNGWWGEGEIKFFLDGDAEFPTICGTGTEDYFCGAWGFGGQTYSTPFLGYPLYSKPEGQVPRHGLYRWHILDPIRFKSDLKVTMQALGWWPNHKFQPLTDDIASVAYWYQAEPHAAFPAMPPVHERYSR